MRMTFDQMQRYRLTGEVIDFLRGKKPLTILDAGSREGFLKNYLPDDRIINLDRAFLGREDFLQGDVLRLPLGDQSVDFAVALDILEHIPPSGRLEFLNELGRVSREGFILAAPFADEKVEEAERLVNEFCLKVTGEENEFLVEHLVEGLPSLEDALQWAKEKEYRTVVLPNGYLYRWVMMMCLNSYLARLAEPWDLIFAANDFYHQRFYREDNREPSYGNLVVFSRGKKLDVAEITAEFSSPRGVERTPADFISLWREMTALIDAEKDRTIERLRREKEEEIKKLIGTIEEKDRRLSEEVGKLTGIIEEKDHRFSEEINKLTGLLDERADDIRRLQSELQSTQSHLQAIQSAPAYRLYSKFARLFKRIP